MSWSPINLAVLQYSDTNGDPYSGAVLKAYASGTSTPISMATDSTGGTTVGSVALNASGHPAVSGNVIVPHVSENYKLALYPTQAAADANSGALWSVDALIPLTTNLAASTGSSLVGHTATGAGAVATTVEEKLRERVSPEDSGAVRDGTTDDSPAFALARTAAAGRTIRARAGTYKFDQVLSSSEDLIIEGDGPATIFDFTGTVTGGDYGFEAIGTATQIEELGATATVGTHSVTFASAPSLAVGDVFVIYNPTDSSWSGFRTYYRAGEWCEVESISGSVVTVRSPLYDTYLAAAVDVYKITGPKVVLKNFAVVGTTLGGLVKTTYCIAPLLENITGDHANDSIVYFDRCFKPRFVNPELSNVGDGGGDYGIVIGNSQHARIIGGSIYARRHAVATGGGNTVCSVPDRDTRTIGAVLKNDIAANTPAADFHGHTEDSSYIDCTIYGGGHLQGKDNEYVNCTITNTLEGYFIYHAEVKGGRLGTRGCKFVSYINPVTVTRGLYDIGGNSSAVTSNTTLPTTFFINDCSVYGRNLSASTSFVLFRNAGSTAKMNFEINGVTANVDALGAVLRTSVASGTADSDFIIVDGIINFPAATILHTAVGASYRDFRHRLQKQTGNVSIEATSGASSGVAAAITLRYTYPRVPAAHVTTIGGINGNRLTYAGLYTLTESAIRPMIESGDQTNWTATSARVVNWTTLIDEV